MFVSPSLLAQTHLYQKAYPTHILATTQNAIVWRDSTKMTYDDGRVKNFSDLLQIADLEDQLAQKYPRKSVNTPAYPNDPGRIRHQPFFEKMYGRTESEVKANLTEIIWLRKSQKKRLLVTKINDVDKHLQAVSDELEQYPALLKYVTNPAGTFKWRTIAGTDRLSMHSFGIAIDINLDYSHYWQWDCKCKEESQTLRYRNLIPRQVVEIFEKHGFIWGGKWYHYDTMHFEYRPELLMRE